MASNHFSINPTGGTDNGTVIVTPLSTNDTQEDKVAIVTIDNGVDTVDVRVTHYGKPSIAIVNGTEPISAPSSGAIYQFLVKTHYDVMFRNKPDWVTIDDGQGNYISSAQTISANVANGHTYNFTVLPNATNSSRSTSNFGLWHKVRGTLQQEYDEVSITQPQGAEDFIVITPTSMIDWDDTNAKNITINANVSYSVSHSNTTDFTLAGGDGYVTIRANANNTGNVLKTDTISVVSTKAGFAYTATCVVTQVRQPRIQLNSSGTINPTGGTGSVWVASDYYWWIQPPVAPDNAGSYITMEGKTAGMNLEPTDGSAYTLTWTSNDGNIRNDNLYVGYLRTNETTGVSTSYATFYQDRAASTGLTVSPKRIPQNVGEYVSSGGGVYTVQVTTDRLWHLNGTPMFCTVSPSTGSGETTVTITVPATNLDRYRSESIYFATNDAGQVASDSVAVYQESIYQEPDYVVVSPTEFNLGSGITSNNTYTVSANTNWYAYIVDTEGYPTIEWVDMPTTGGTSGYTTGLHFEVAANNTNSARTAVLQFTTGSPTIYATITINQSAGTAVVQDNITLSSTGASVDSGSSVIRTINVTASNDWTLSTDVNWLRWYASAFAQSAMTSGTSGTTTIYRRIDENSGSSRTGTTTFTCGTASTTYVVEQAEGYVEPPTPVGNLELDPAQISPASRSYQIYEVEVWNDSDEDYTIDYGDDWAQFYDGPYPSTADAVSIIPNGERLVLYLEVQAGQSRNMVITFTGEDSGTQVGFYVNQP